MSDGASHGVWALFKSASVHGVMAVPIETALHELIKIFHNELHGISAKLDRLIENALVQAKDNLEMSKRYPQGSLEQQRCFEKARDLFHSASANLDKVYKPQALMSASACCSMLSDPIGAKFFYERAIEAAEVEHKKLVESVMSGKGSKLKTTCTISGGASGAIGVSSIVVGITGVGLPIAAAMMGSAIASGVAAYKSSEAFGELEHDLDELARLGKEIGTAKRYHWRTSWDITRELEGDCHNSGEWFGLNFHP